jgi:hypothetical protein
MYPERLDGDDSSNLEQVNRLVSPWQRNMIPHFQIAGARLSMFPPVPQMVQYFHVFCWYIVKGEPLDS